MHPLFQQLPLDFIDDIQTEMLGEIQQMLRAESHPESKHQNFEIITVLPSKPPRIFGRDNYVQTAVDLLLRGANAGRAMNIPIMGPGGMGKTTTALAILHHPQIKDHFQSNIFFISCEAIKASEALIRAVMESFSFTLGPGNLLKQFVTALQSYTSPAIICLDNFETIWENEDHQNVSNILGHITSCPSISILITMCGTLLNRVPE